jgi:hypothetical protein
VAVYSDDGLVGSVFTVSRKDKKIDGEDAKSSKKYNPAFPVKIHPFKSAPIWN